MSGNCPGKVQKKSGKSPGKVREKSGKSLKCTYKGLDIWYRNGEGLGVLLSAYRDYNSSYDPERGQETKEIKGIQVSYSIDTYLFLPPDEIPSDEEQKRADTDPHYFISYGSDCREIQQISNCIFSKDGIGYLLMSTDIPIPSNEMFGFAEILLSQ